MEMHERLDNTENVVHVQAIATRGTVEVYSRIRLVLGFPYRTCRRFEAKSTEVLTTRKMLSKWRQRQCVAQLK
jgi:hypothetical protein